MQASPVEMPVRKAFGRLGRTVAVRLPTASSRLLVLKGEVCFAASSTTTHSSQENHIQVL